MRTILVLAAIATACSTISAPARSGMIGSWFVSSETDSFSDQATNVAVIPSSNGLYVLGLRCINKEPTMLILAGPRGEDNFVRSARYNIKFRVDKGNVKDLDGLALKEKGVEIMLSKETFDAIAGASMFAMRLTSESSDTVTDMVFNPRQSKEALTDIVNACAL